MGDHPEGDVVVGQGPAEAAADGLGQQQEEGNGRPSGQGPGYPHTHEDDGQDQTGEEKADDPQPRPVLKADQGIGSGSAQRQGQYRAGQADDQGVHVRAGGIMPDIHKNIPPGMEGRLEVHKGNVLRPCVDVNGQLEGSHQQPVEGEEDHQRPEA